MCTTPHTIARVDPNEEFGREPRDLRGVLEQVGLRIHQNVVVSELRFRMVANSQVPLVLPVLLLSVDDPLNLFTVTVKGQVA